MVGQWASYRNKGCVDGHCVQLGAIAWGWPPAWQTSAASAATSSCCSVAFSALCAAAAACSAAAAKSTADRTRWAARSASLALLRGPSTCRRLSLTPATLMLSSFQMRAVLRVDQLEQFLRALSIRSAVQLLSTRVRWSSRAHQRREYTPCLHTSLACIHALCSSVDDDLIDALKAANNASAWRSGSAPPNVCVLTAAQVLGLHTSKNATYISK